VPFLPTKQCQTGFVLENIRRITGPGRVIDSNYGQMAAKGLDINRYNLYFADCHVGVTRGNP